jgi:hypothetical protein
MKEEAHEGHGKAAGGGKEGEEKDPFPREVEALHEGLEVMDLHELHEFFKTPRGTGGDEPDERRHADEEGFFAHPPARELLEKAETPHGRHVGDFFTEKFELVKLVGRRI